MQSLLSMLDKYKSDDECRNAIEEIRWPNGVACTRCGDMSIGEIPKRNQYQCHGADISFP